MQPTSRIDAASIPGNFTVVPCEVALEAGLLTDSKVADGDGAVWDIKAPNNTGCPRLAWRVSKDTADFWL